MDKIKKTYIIMPNQGELDLNYLIETATELRKYKWDFKKWIKKPALIDKPSSSSREFVGQNYDSKYFDLVQDCWTHDHCEICFTTISEGDDDTKFETHGFNFENGWICRFCYENFIESENLYDAIEKFKKIEKY